MYISFFILLLIIYTFIKTVSFAIWCFKDKNTAGGISVIFISLLVLAGGAVLLK